MHSYITIINIMNIILYSSSYINAVQPISMVATRGQYFDSAVKRVI